MVCWKGERNCTRERPGLMIVVDARCVATGMLSACADTSVRTCQECGVVKAKVQKALGSTAA